MKFLKLEKVDLRIYYIDMLLKKNDLQYLVLDEYYHSFLNDQEEIVKVFLVSELKEIFFGAVNPKAYIYLMSKYNISYKLAKTYIDNIVNLRINDKHNIPSIILELIEIKKDLEKNNFISPSFRLPLLKKGLTLKGYSYEFNDIKKLLNDNNIDFVEDYLDKSLLNHDVYLYSTKILEIVDSLNYIAEKINNGIDLNDIIIVAPDNYHYMIENVIRLFDIPLQSEEIALNKTLLSFEVYNFLKQGIEIEDDLITEKEEDSFTLKEIKEKIKEILDEIKVYKEDMDLSQDIVSNFYLYKASKCKLSASSSGIKIKTSLRESKNKYVYILGFTETLLPVYKDDDYLSDKNKEDYSYLLTSYEKNEISKKKFRSLIDECEEVRISYSLDSEDEVNRAYNDDPTFKDVEDFDLKKERYSLKADEFLYASYELNKRLFGFKNSFLKYLEGKEFSNVNSYINDSNFHLDDSVKIELKRISYSGIKAYFECPFKYFCSRILYINSDINNELPLIFGNLVHDKLENYILTQGEHIDKPIIDETINLSSGELYFLNKRIEGFMSIVPDLESVLSGFSDFKKHPEFELTIPFDDEHLLYVKYDLFMFNDKFFYIVDYKTGNDSFTYDLAMNGFNMQLPIYLYVANKYYNDKRPLGAFLHLIGNEKLTLNGLTDEEENLSLYLGDNENKIKGFKRKKPYVITKEDYDALMDNVKTRITDAIKGIEKGEFEIAPKVIYINTTSKANACDFCEFKDCCSLKNYQIKRVFIRKESGED